MQADTSRKTAAESRPHSNGELNGACVSVFADAYATEPQDCVLADVLESIRNGTYAKLAARARELFQKWKAVCPALDSKESPEAKHYDAFKKTMPAFAFSGTFSKRGNAFLKEHSDLLQVDLDKLFDKTLAIRDRVRSDPHVLFGFLSPSGEGIKLGLRIDGARHEESFLAAEKYFVGTYGLTIDRQCKDVSRLCFMSDDPALWINPRAEILPIPEKPASAPVPENESDTPAGSDILILPSGSILGAAISITESAREIFKRIAPTHTLFYRGGALTELVSDSDGPRLDIVRPDAFRSICEKHGRLFKWGTDSKGKPVLRPARLSGEDAKALMAASEARELLPPVAGVLNCPVLIESRTGAVVLGKGYHPEHGGLLILHGDAPPPVSLENAIFALKWIIDQFDFQSPGDHSRGLAALITPALRMGGHIQSRVPITVLEADLSQAGKGHFHELTCAIYRETPRLVTQRDGGVGSKDESLSSALIGGRPFVCLDNNRGKMDSQNLEAFLTCPGLFPVRVPYRGEILIDPRRFILQFTSNGVETTRDLANRATFIRIQKRPGFQYRDTLGEIIANQPFYLGSVFSVIAEWLAAGKPRSADTRHDFREWNQLLDWIIQNIFKATPLMDGHETAQERVSNPALSWVRAVALALADENRLGTALIASEIVDLCGLHDLGIPGLREFSPDTAKPQVGRIMRRLFGSCDRLEADSFTVTRTAHEYRKPSGDRDTTPAYTFTRE